MNKVLFAFKNEGVTAKNTTLPDKQQLFSKLQERALQPVVSLDGELAFDDTGVKTHELVGDHETRALGHVAIDEVGAIVNRLDRSFRYEEAYSKKDGSLLPSLPQPWIEADKTIINENAMRSLAFRKARVQQEILDPLEIGMPTQLIKSPVDVAVFVHENPSDYYIVKPNSGTGSESVRKLTSEQVLALPNSEFMYTEMIIQPCYDFTGPFNAEIRPYDRQSQEAFMTWNRSDVVKELRMYSFYTDQSIAIFPVARAMADGVDYWLFVDPESIPQSVYNDTHDTVSYAAQATGSRAVYAALDFGYGSHKDEAPDYHIVELNARMPYLIGYDKHPEVADKLREYLADQIKDAATQKHTSSKVIE